MTNLDDQIIMPDVWGPHAWKFIHYVTLGYPENPTPYQKERYKIFLLLLQDVLPCSLCANHYKENLQKYPLTNDILNSRDKFIKWGINMHNIVNELNNKPILKYIDAIKIIDTDVQCKPKTIEIIKDNKPSNIEPFNDLSDNTNNTLLLIKQNIPVNPNNIYVNDNINIVYILISIFFGLIFIAIVYKKK
jgi:hypothetical protein